MTEENNNNGAKWRKKLYNEITLGLALVSIVRVIFTLVMFIMKPDIQLDKKLSLLQQQVNTIETNDLVHVQGSLDRVEKNQETNTANINTININVAKILATMGIE